MRHQTLRACVDRSFELCSKPERVLWARLAVFVGGFELDAVEGVCADAVLPAGDLLDLVSALLDKSVLIRDDPPDGRGGRARYRMLATIRDYGQEQLREAGERQLLRRRHLDWYQRLVDQADAQWASSRETHWTARLTREHPNLRTAIEYGATEPEQAEAALHLAITMPLAYWFGRGLFTEAQRLLGHVLARTTRPSAQRARALLFTSQLAIVQGNRDAGRRLLAEGEDLARQLDATLEIAHAAFVRGLTFLYQGDLPPAAEAFEQAGTVLSGVPKSGLEMDLRLGQLNALAMVAGLAGDHDRAAACLNELLAICEARGIRRHQAHALWAKALSAWRRDNLAETTTWLTASLRLKQTPAPADPYGAARCIEATAWVAARRQQFRRAAVLLGAAEAVWHMIGARVTTFGHLIDDHETCERTARAGLDETAFAGSFAQGRALLYDDAIAYALDQRRHRPAPPPAGAPTPLTRREQQIAGLIATGRSNQEIADALVISRRTAESHVEHILAKLGFTSRTQIAAWVTAHHARSTTAEQDQ
jgi:DNA-binding CsgD family transcriptional regulator